jgi:hypothetical protein
VPAGQRPLAVSGQVEGSPFAQPDRCGAVSLPHEESAFLLRGVANFVEEKQASVVGERHGQRAVEPGQLPFLAAAGRHTQKVEGAARSLDQEPAVPRHVVNDEESGRAPEHALTARKIDRHDRVVALASPQIDQDLLTRGRPEKASCLELRGERRDLAGGIHDQELSIGQASLEDGDAVPAGREARPPNTLLRAIQDLSERILD